MTTCLSNREVARAVNVLERMQSGGLADARAYDMLLAGLAQHGAVERGPALVRAAQAAGVAVTPARLEQLLRGLADAGLLERQGLPLLEALRASGASVDHRLLSLSLR